MQEIWKEVADYNGLYQVSNMGNVRRSGKVHKARTNRDGYIEIKLSLNGEKKNHSIHRLVAIAFIPNPENKSTVNHKDGNKQNNIVTNIEWMTRSENMLHAYRVLRIKNPMEGKLGDDNSLSMHFQIKYPNGKIVRYGSSHEFARETGFDRTSIRNARKKGLPYRFKQGKIKGLEVRA